MTEAVEGSVKTQSLGDLIKNHPVVVYGACLISAFAAGVAAYTAILTWSGREVTSKDSIAQATVVATKLEATERERDALRIEVAQLKQASSLAASLGGDVIAYQSVDVKKQAGSYFYIGRCPGRQCYVFGVNSVRLTQNNPEMQLSLTGEPMTNNTIIWLLPIKRGERIGVATSEVDFILTVEEDRVSDIRLGIALRPGTAADGEKSETYDGNYSKRKAFSEAAHFKQWGLEPHQAPFSAQANAQKDLAGALAKAKQEGKLVFVEFGANWCPDCLVLHRLLLSNEVKPYLDKHFVRVTVDVGRMTQNLDIVERYGLSLRKGIPAAVFLRPDGSVMGQTKNGELEPARRFGSKQILAFLMALKEDGQVIAPK